MAAARAKARQLLVALRSGFTVSGSRPMFAVSCGRIPRSAARRSNITASPPNCWVGFLLAIAILMPLYTAIAGAALALDRCPKLTIAADQLRAPGPVGSVRALSCAPLSPDAHRISRSSASINTDRRWRYAICRLLVVVRGRRSDAGLGLSVGAGEPATIQDASHQLRRSPRLCSPARV